MNTPQNWVRWSVVLTGAAYAGVLYVAGVHVQSGVKYALAYLPTAAALLVVLFDKWLWHLPVVRATHGRPWIHGLWRAELQPDGASHIPEGGNRGPITAYVVVEQSYWSVFVTQFTAESVSESMAATYMRNPDTRRQLLSFTYDNRPGRKHVVRSPRHVGTCELSVVGAVPKAVRGTYFTDRFTAGEMRLDFVDRTTSYSDFGAADDHARAAG